MAVRWINWPLGNVGHWWFNRWGVRFREVDWWRPTSFRKPAAGRATRRVFLSRRNDRGRRRTTNWHSGRWF
jgi:hypothetical protein